MKGEVETLLSSSSSLHITIDESTNVSTNRIINTSVVTNLGDSFYQSNTKAEVGKLGVDKLACYIIEAASQISNRDILKVASITTDTCLTMQGLWRQLEKHPNTNYIFIVLYDSYSLQLIFKDLLQHPTIKEAQSIASTIVNGLQNSSKQLAYLYEE